MSARDMRELSMTRKLGLLLALYFSQGLPFGFFQQALPVMLRDRGYSLKTISLASLLSLPWALKFLWAPFVDSTESRPGAFGRRKIWILPLQALMALVLAAVGVGTVDFDLRVVVGAILLINLLASTQDIATDGLAVDMLHSDERGLANGLQVAGYRIGMVVGGGALLILYTGLGWQNTFLAMATLIAVASLPLLLTTTPEPPFTRPIQIDPARPLANFWELLSGFARRPGAPHFMALIVVYKLGDSLALGMVRPLLIDRGVTMTEIGWLLGTVGFTASLVGAMLGGALVTRIGRTTSMVIFGAMQAATVIGYGFVAADPHASRLILYVLAAAEHFAGGMATTALFTRMMDWCRPASSATDYTVQASLYVIATGAATSISGFVAEALGYTNHFFLSGAIAVAAIVLVRPLDKTPPTV